MVEKDSEIPNVKDSKNVVVEPNTSSLSELMDSKNPTLQKFRECCPGSYKHSQLLASMVEGLSLELGINEDLMKAAALYHDIGKSFNPTYFTENQHEDTPNPHADVDSRISYELITRHVSDSVALLVNDPRFPRKLIEIISQHHGTSVVRYFFVKSGSNAEDNYRYKTQKPTSIESALLMICDQIEATSRSIISNNKKIAPNDVINTTINRLLDDGQLDDVYMRMGDLKKIRESLIKEIEGTFQKRIDYENDDSNEIN